MTKPLLPPLKRHHDTLEKNKQTKTSAKLITNNTFFGLKPTRSMYVRI